MMIPKKMAKKKVGILGLGISGNLEIWDAGDRTRQKSKLKSLSGPPEGELKRP